MGLLILASPIVTDAEMSNFLILEVIPKREKLELKEVVPPEISEELPVLFHWTILAFQCIELSIGDRDLSDLQ